MKNIVLLSCLFAGALDAGEKPTANETRMPFGKNFSSLYYFASAKSKQEIEEIIKNNWYGDKARIEVDPAGYDTALILTEQNEQYPGQTMQGAMGWFLYFGRKPRISSVVNQCNSARGDKDETCKMLRGIFLELLNAEDAFEVEQSKAKFEKDYIKTPRA